MSTQKAVFKCEDVIATIRQLYNAANDAGLIFNAKGELSLNRWYAPALRVDWASKRSGNNGTVRWTILYKQGTVEAPLQVALFDEKHVGPIAPLTEEEVARINAVSKSKWPVKKRDKGVSLSVYRFSTQVKCDGENSIVPCRDALGEFILPGDEYRSRYFILCEMIDVMYRTELGIAIRDGMIIPNDATSAKRQVKGELPKSVFLAPNMKVCTLIDRAFSKDAGKNAYQDRPDPLTRIKCDFDEKKGDGPIGFKLYDKTKPFVTDSGKTAYEVAKAEMIPDSGVFVPVNAKNVHNFIRSRAGFDGVVGLDNVCSSNMGFSIPVRFAVCVMTPPANRSIDVDDLYGSMDNMSIGGGGAAVSSAPVLPVSTEIAKAEPPAAAVSSLAAVAPVDNSDVDDLMAELAGGSGKK